MPAGAAAGTGLVAVLGADGQPGPVSARTFTVVNFPTPPAAAPAVALLVTDPEAAQGDGTQPGRFRLTRTDGDAGTAGQPLTVRFKVQTTSTARRDVDYQLVYRGVVLPTGTNALTLPAGKLATGLEVVPRPGGGVGTVNVKLAADPAGTYALGDGRKGTVTIR